MNLRARNLAFVVALVALSGPSVRAQESRDGLAEQVRATEIAFARAVMEKDAAAFAAKIDPGAVFVSGDEATVGREKIVAEWSVFFAEGAPYFEWHPEIVELSADGTLGLSRGPWVMRGRRADGSAFERQGIFNSVWRRQEDGSWRIVFDAGCSPCPACPE